MHSEWCWAIDTLRTKRLVPANQVTVTNKPNNVQRAILSGIEIDSDSGEESDHLVAKYLSLQSQIYQIEPELLKSGKGASKKSKFVESNPDIARLLAKVDRIESDILFDRNEAYSQWIEMQKNLAKEVAERKRFQLDQDSKAKADTVTVPQSKPTHLLPTDEDEDLVEMVGDLFSSLPETSTNAFTGSTQMTSKTAEGETVTLRDFGTWAGMNPRRILEDTCKARFEIHLRNDCRLC